MPPFRVCVWRHRLSPSGLGFPRASVTMSDEGGKMGLLKKWSFLGPNSAARPAIDSASVERRPWIAHDQTGLPVH